MKVGLKKTRISGLRTVGKNRMILCSLVLTHYQRVTDRHAAYAYDYVAV